MPEVYGIQVNGIPALKTLFSHPRGAVVNFLTMVGTPVFDSMDDEDIRYVWLEKKREIELLGHRADVFKASLADIEPIDISEGEIAPPNS